MSKKTVVTCDLCGDEIDESNSYIVLAVDGGYPESYTEHHLHRACFARTKIHTDEWGETVWECGVHEIDLGQDLLSKEEP